MLQWAQLFESLTPTGILGLCSNAPIARKAALLVLLPLSLLRLTHFAWNPMDHVDGSRWHATDNALAVVWGAWLTMAAALAPATIAEARESRYHIRKSCLHKDI